MLLQWPHQGAWNFTNTVFPATASAHDSFVSDVARDEPAKAANNKAAPERRTIALKWALRRRCGERDGLEPKIA